MRCPLCEGKGRCFSPPSVPDGASSWVCDVCEGSGRVAKYRRCALCPTVIEMEYLRNGTWVTGWLPARHENKPVCIPCFNSVSAYFKRS